VNKYKKRDLKKIEKNRGGQENLEDQETPVSVAKPNPEEKEEKVL